MPGETADNATGIDEIVVNANLTTQQDGAQNGNGVNSNDESSFDAKTQINRLESELKSIKSKMNCMIHSEFDNIKNYLDRALERDRLTKRP